VNILKFIEKIQKTTNNENDKENLIDFINSIDFSKKSAIKVL
jgi:hypothetical protein